jgi:Spy/CpxP family protein refolding chaperone
MKRKLVVFAVLAIVSTLPPKIQAQNGQRGQRLEQVEQIAGQLNLTPQQKAQLIPVLRAEAPKVKAIKDDPSLSGIQKMRQLKAVHDETDPQVKAILTPQQYQTLQEIRRREIQQAIRSRQGR